MENINYCGILTHEDLELYKIENNCINKLLVILSCKLEDEFHGAQALIINKSSGEIVHQCRRTSIC